MPIFKVKNTTQLMLQAFVAFFFVFKIKSFY